MHNYLYRNPRINIRKKFGNHAIVEVDNDLDKRFPEDFPNATWLIGGVLRQYYLVLLA